MILKKKGETFDVYSLEISFKELQAIQASCSECGDPIGDEVARGIDWYLANIVPPPGMEEHPAKAETADELLPSADVGGGGGAPGGPAGPGAAPAGGEPPLGGEDELPPGDEGPGGPGPEGLEAPGGPGEEAEVKVTHSSPSTPEVDELLPAA